MILPIGVFYTDNYCTHCLNDLHCVYVEDAARTKEPTQCT